MSILPSWGSEVRKLRKKASLTQGQLIERFSLLTNDLPEQERYKLEEVGIYEEAAAYFSGILDTPTLSRLEKGTRTLTLRQRTMAFVWGFRQLGVLQTIEEANHFLEIGGHGNLTNAEVKALFAQSQEEQADTPPVDAVTSEQMMPKQVVSEQVMSEQVVPEQYRGDEQVSNRSLPLVVGGLLLAILLAGLLLQLFFTNSPPKQTETNAASTGIKAGISQPESVSPESISVETATPSTASLPPAIVEDFATKTIDPAKWNKTNAPSTTINGGQLWFDTPVNEGEEWASESLEYNGEIGLISRLSFDVAIETPYNDITSGSLGIVTGCQNDSGWLNIFAGEDPLHLFAEYAIQDQTVNGERIEIMSIESGQPYTVDMRWNGDGVELLVQGQNDIELPLIPCNQTQYFNISASVDAGEKVKGFVDQIRVWN